MPYVSLRILMRMAFVAMAGLLLCGNGDTANAGDISDKIRDSRWEGTWKEKNRGEGRITIIYKDGGSAYGLDCVVKVSGSRIIADEMMQGGAQNDGTFAVANQKQPRHNADSQGTPSLEAGGEQLRFASITVNGPRDVMQIEAVLERK